MHINFCCPYWGRESMGIAAFFSQLKAASYNGVEVFFNGNVELASAVMKEVEVATVTDSQFQLIVQHMTPCQSGDVNLYTKDFERQLQQLSAFQPSFINSHTGRDYFSFDDNCRIIEAALQISIKTGIRVLHETHRGCFSFHAASLLPYLKKFPEMELTADFSHFCTVSESLLQDQKEILQQIIPHVSHIHARVGYEQSPQVNDPFAPEWKNHLVQFENWWQQIIHQKKEKGWVQFSITPEFGPAPYMPLLPFTQMPIGNQWDINVKMMQYLRNIN